MGVLRIGVLVYLACASVVSDEDAVCLLQLRGNPSKATVESHQAASFSEKPAEVSKKMVHTDPLDVVVGENREEGAAIAGAEPIRQHSQNREEQRRSLGQVLWAFAFCSAAVALLWVVGALEPYTIGIAACLACTDAGCLATASEAGAYFGYRFASLQLLLIPLLYCTQELAVRLGASTQTPLVVLMKQRWGREAAGVVTVMLLVTCAAAVLSNLRAVFEIGAMWQISAASTCSLVAIILALPLALQLSKSSFKPTTVLICGIGLGTLMFPVLMAYSNIDQRKMTMATTADLGKDETLKNLAAANIGSVMVPWLLFFQQGAMIKSSGTRLVESMLQSGRIGTAIGAVLAQILMFSILVATAAADDLAARPVDTARYTSMVTAFSSEFTLSGAQLAVGTGIISSALVSMIVALQTSAWVLEDLVVDSCGDKAPPRLATGAYAGSLILFVSLALVGVTHQLLDTVAQVVDGFLTPAVVAFLYAEAVWFVHKSARLSGRVAWATGVVLVLGLAVAVTESFEDIFIFRAHV
mmetsp:Transcript_27081/g.65128  ORF Transcript_27081/g.65128 Transcript_27081/m.65128 type:complete len:527 (+) Transcript_27081:98-1678(+)